MSQSDALIQALNEAHICFLQKEILAGHCTFRIGGPADLLIQPVCTEQICHAAALCRQYGVRYYFIGNGSNILFSDAGFRGAIIDISSLESGLCMENDVVTASAGCMLSKLCLFACKAGLAGLEFAYGIPGTVGGAVYMNAGAYGGEIRDVLLDAQVMLPDGTVKTFTAQELSLSYRHSILAENGGCVLQARFRLMPGDAEAIRKQMDALMAKRRDKQPLDKPSAGSTFKRPEGAFAAALIDQCGLRGYRIGGAAVSDKHCGFVVNMGGARCADVLALCTDVARVVKEKTGYTLEKEIRVVE